MAISFSGKKPIKQTKLKDQNINQKLTKEQKTNFSPQNIINDIYNDEQNKEENEPNPSSQKNISENDDNKEESNNKNNLEITKNEERKKRALNSLELEYNKRKNELENEKEEINVLYNQNKENKIGKKLYNYLSSIDYRLYENEEFKKNEEKLIQLTIAKRERTDQNDIFEYEEEWMDNIIIINILKHCFDFQRALIGIHSIFKEKNVKNYLLFNELDLRNRWTFLEFNKYRKNNDDTFYYLKNEEVYNEDILDLISGKKIEDNNDIVKNKNNENKLKINIEEGDIDENNNKDALLIESHNEQKKQDLDELD